MQEKYFYVGQTVYSSDYGKGSVVRIKDSGNYIIVVDFEGGYGSFYYTFDGRAHIHSPISLFQEPIILPTNKPLPNISKGDIIWVKDFENTQWECRYFSHFTDFSRTKVACFTDQKKDGDTKEWCFWSEFQNVPF